VDIILGSALTVAMCLGLLWLVLRHRSLSRFRAAVHRESCKVCGCSFEDTFPDFLGRITADDARRLDNFQKRFAIYRVYCNNCSAICLCAKDGTVISGYVVRE
jgi:hypothetical protein